MQFKNKTAIVTGSGQGIGLGIAYALAGQGCKVVVTDINQETSQKAADKIKEVSEDVLSVVCDVSSEADVKKLMKETMDRFGSIDILVNNAGIYPFSPFQDISQDDWNKVMDVNMKGVFLCTKYALPHMKAGARIINISSIASMVGFENLVHYCASKGGVNAFTRALALELAPQDITVNAIAPGGIETPGTAMPDEQKGPFLKAIPMGKFGDPMDIAGLAVYLASDIAGYLTGQTIVVDGGWTLR